MKNKGRKQSEGEEYFKRKEKVIRKIVIMFLIHGFMELLTADKDHPFSNRGRGLVHTFKKHKYELCMLYICVC